MPEAGPGVGFPHPSSAPKTLVTWEVPARRAGGAPTDATRGRINTGERQNKLLVRLRRRALSCTRRERILTRSSVFVQAATISGRSATFLTKTSGNIQVR